ncbi:Centaurin-gamma-1A, partial [Gryllus bimaculatus]
PSSPPYRKAPPHAPLSRPRKSRRRSNLFTPSKKGDDKLRNGGCELGSGRAIPLKQGYLYKRSSKALNKEWKKKYVTLCDDGRLTYHPSLHDYMDDVHGKEIPLQYVTVKVPGQRPRGSKAVPASQPGGNGLADGLGSLTISSFQSKEQRRAADKVLLTAFELLREPGGAGGAEDAAALASTALAALNGCALDAKADTPNWHFEAGNSEERDEWVAAIEQQILTSLQGNESGKAKSRLAGCVDAAAVQAVRSRVPGNSHCADCDAPNPDWASLNLGVVVCIECSGIHRNLGSHISRVRSLDLDEWPPGHLAVMLSLGNALANSVWEVHTRSRAKPTPNSSREEKERWIRSKYEAKEFLASAPSGAPLAQQLLDAVRRSDMKSLALLLAHASTDQVNATVSARDLRTPLHLACATGNLAAAQLLLWHNANAKAVDHEGRSCLAYARAAANVALSKAAPMGGPLGVA